VTIEGEWPIGDEDTWKTALKAQTVDPDDPQDVANSVVRHVTTSLARQAFNIDDVS
jgi:starch phosphorylase